MLFVHVEKLSNWHKRKNSQKQAFTDVLQKRCSQKFGNIRKKTPVLESHFDKVAGLKAWIFIKAETPTQVFSCEYCEIIKNNFFLEHPLLIILLRNFIGFFGHLWVQNWYFSYFLGHCSVLFHNSSLRIGCPWLFCACIYI